MLLAIFKQFQSKNFAKLLVIQYLLNVMSKTLGIIGGGQLGMMLTEAAQNLDDISKIIVLDPTENCPAAKVGAQQIIADFKDEDSIKKYSKNAKTLRFLIEDTGRTLAQSAIKFCLSQPSIVSVLPNVTDIETLNDYVLSSNSDDLADHELLRIEELWQSGFET